MKSIINKIIVITALSNLYSCDQTETNGKHVSEPKQSRVIVSSMDTVRDQNNIRDDTVIGGFFKRANKCPVEYYPGGINEGELDVLCPDGQFLLVFSVKDTTAELYVDDFIFKKGTNRVRELTENYSVFDQFDCYAFVFPHDKNKADIYGLNARFPFVVTGYKRITGDNWRKMGTAKVNTDADFSKFEAYTELR